MMSGAALRLDVVRVGFVLSMCLVAIEVTACVGHTPPHLGNSGGVEVLEVLSAEYHGAGGQALEAACRNWSLSTQQVESFFRFSDRYPQTPYGGFYQVDCGISGQLRANGQRWKFAINGGGVATWEAGQTTLHFGCSASECSSLLLLPSDGMEPD